MQEIVAQNFPDWLKLREATVTLNEMGDRTISAQVYIDNSVTPTFIGTDNNPLAVTFREEKFIMPLREPQMCKGTDRPDSVVDLTFYSYPVYQLKRYYFVEMASVGSTSAQCVDKYKASLALTAKDFVDDLNKVLSYYFGTEIQAVWNTAATNTEIKYISIENTYIWDVIQKYYETYDLRWHIDKNSQGNYIITFGYEPSNITHEFEYGYEGGLLKVERQVQDENIRNKILGRGGDTNIPKYYFKTNPNTEEGTAAAAYRSDPDAIDELKNVYFGNLRDYNFRLYVQGWAAGKGYTGHSYESTKYSTEFAYKQGYDTAVAGGKFDPIEYVKDDDSISKYGELWGNEDGGDDIYPSIQGMGDSADLVVAAEQVTDDDRKEGVTKEIGYVTFTSQTLRFNAGQTRTETFRGTFTVPTNTEDAKMIAVLESPVITIKYPERTSSREEEYDAANFTSEITSRKFINATSKTEVTEDSLVAGTYYYDITVECTNSLAGGSGKIFEIGIGRIAVTYATVDADSWNGTFNIWIKNIWGSSKNTGETNEEYVDRIWLPILGTTEEAAVSFSTGPLAASSDWSFKVNGSSPTNGVHFDDSRAYTINGVTHKSHWRLTLCKSEAEMNTTNDHVPCVGTNAEAGNSFYFTGIDVPQQYVEWAEQKLRTYKQNILDEVCDTQPQWAVTLDKVRVQHLLGSETEKLVDILDAGKQITIKDDRILGSGNSIEIYIQTLTYKWSDTAIIPDVEITLAEKATTTLSSVNTLQNKVKQVTTQLVSLEDVQNTVEGICSKQYLQKSGAAQESISPTRFASTVSDTDFVQSSQAGSGWGFYKNRLNPSSDEDDARYETVLEVDKLIARKGIESNEVVVNQIAYVGGKQIISAACIECTKVVTTAYSYTCYFDNKGGTVQNLFVVGDVAMGQMFSPTNVQTAFYKYKVSEVGLNYIVLSRAVCYAGSSAPVAGDVIVQYGNYSTVSRQYAILRDVIGGGYEKMVSGLSNVDTDGVQYYFAGYQNSPKWFVGDSTNYAKYENGVLSIKGNISASDGTNIDDLKYLMQALGNANGGLILANQMAVHNGSSIQGGISGVYDSTLGSKSIAAWFGGSKVDKESTGATTCYIDVSGSDERLKDSDGNLFLLKSGDTDYATSLFRFDGTGYLASGNISWDRSGNVTLNGGQVKISGSSDETLASLVTAMANFASMFEKDTTTTPGTTYIRAKYSLYSDGSVSAGGIGSGGSGGGTGGIATITLNSLSGYCEVTGSTANLDMEGFLTTKGYVKGSVVTTIGSQSGAITLRGGQSTNGAVNLAMNGNQLYASIVGLGSLAYKSSLASSDLSDAASLITSSNISSQSVSYAATAGSAPASDVYSWAKAASKPTYTLDEVTDGTTRIWANKQNVITSSNKLAYSLISGTPTSLKNPYSLTFGSKTYDGSAAKEILKSDIGLGDVENKSAATILGEMTSSNVTTALGYTPYNATNPDGYITSSGTAAKAGQLATAHTIWGRSFDGTANIAGPLTGVSDISASGSIEALSLTIADSAEISEITIENGNEINVYSGTLYLQAQGSATGNILLCCGGGNVGIGTTSPSYILEVGGTVGAVALVLAGTITGATNITASGNIQGDKLAVGAASHLIEWDSTNNAFKFNGNLYATGSVSAGGAGSTQGGITTVTTISATTYTMTAGEGYAMYIATGSSLSITLPSSPVTGRHFKIWDQSGALSIVNNTKTCRIYLGNDQGAITTSDAAIDLSSDYGSYYANVWEFLYDGTAWHITPIADVY